MRFDEHSTVTPNRTGVPRKGKEGKERRGRNKRCRNMPRAGGHNDEEQQSDAGRKRNNAKFFVQLGIGKAFQSSICNVHVVFSRDAAQPILSSDLVHRNPEARAGQLFPTCKHNTSTTYVILMDSQPLAWAASLEDYLACITSSKMLRACI
jgi:hypothetical protein